MSLAATLERFRVANTRSICMYSDCWRLQIPKTKAWLVLCLCMQGEGMVYKTHLFSAYQIVRDTCIAAALAVAALTAGREERLSYATGRTAGTLKGVAQSHPVREIRRGHFETRSSAVLGHEIRTTERRR